MQTQSNPGVFQGRVKGFSLIELVITVSVLAILTLGVIPLMQVSVKRQKEQQLRETLREVRLAIDQFKREADAAPRVPQGSSPEGVNPNNRNNAGGTGCNPLADPRIHVFISDQTIFTADNPDRYPPDLDTLVKGVNVLPCMPPMQLQGGFGMQGNKGIADVDQSTIPKTKIYLRRIPVDPMTGKAEWDFRSCYDASDTTSWGGENVFDVHSKSKDTALNGEKYSDW